MARVMTIAIAVCLTAFAAEPAWESIAIDSELTGWKVISGEWSVNDGVLVGKAASGQAVIVLARPLADFDCEVEAYSDAETAGAVFIRAHAIPTLPVTAGTDPASAPKTVYGYRCALDTTATGVDTTIEIVTFPAVMNASVGPALELKPKAWNKAEIRAHGADLTFAVNGSGNWRREGEDTFLAGSIALTVGRPEATTPSEMKFRTVRVRDCGREGAWRAIWNGVNLDEFELWGEEEWRVEDGKIVGSSGPKKSEGYAKTKESFKDFRVRGTYQMSGDGNYGLFYHSTIAYDEKRYPIISGVQGEVAWGWPAPSGGVYESYKRGWLIEPDMNTVGAFAQDPTGSNEIEILAEGSRRATWINGVKVVDLVDEKLNYTEGSFALQLHSGGVSGISWRGLYVLAP